LKSKVLSELPKSTKPQYPIALTSLNTKLLKEVGYLQMWESENTLESQGRIANIEEFINSLNDFSNITEFLEYVSLVEARDDKNLQEAVSVMTVHGSKGLEFDMVFLPGLEDGIFPSNKSIDERNGVEEERRLMYVAITRAKKHLIMSFAKSRYIFGDVVNSMPSRFIKELPESEIDFEEVNFANNNWQKNSNDFFNDDFEDQNYANKKYPVKNNFKSSNHFQAINNFQKKSTANFIVQNEDKSMINKRVFHQKFGYGKVLEVDGEKLKIKFEKSDVKMIMKNFITS
jgi:DNA helicase-2/ATP-dependent DNA helicase PcrA